MFPLAHMGLPMVPFLSAGKVPKWAPLVAFGGLLPDLIDKPLGHLVLPENNGRIFAHTLLFGIAILMLGMAWTKAMPVAYGVLTHHLLDGMFLDTTSALWPFMGPFQTTEFTYYVWFEHLFQPFYIASEVVGLALLIWWASSYVRGRRAASKTIYN